MAIKKRKSSKLTAAEKKVVRALAGRRQHKAPALGEQGQLTEQENRFAPEQPLTKKQLMTELTALRARTQGQHRQIVGLQQQLDRQATQHQAEINLLERLYLKAVTHGAAGGRSFTFDESERKWRGGPDFLALAT